MANNKLHPGQARTVKKERADNLENVKEFLATKNIVGEKVLDYICFTYKGNDYRVRTVTDAKVAFGLNTY